VSTASARGRSGLPVSEDEERWRDRRIVGSRNDLDHNPAAATKLATVNLPANNNGIRSFMAHLLLFI
jgi:hypothetical protein